MRVHSTYFHLVSSLCEVSWRGLRGRIMYLLPFTKWRYVQGWWHTPIILTLGWLKQVDWELKVRQIISKTRSRRLHHMTWLHNSSWLSHLWTQKLWWPAWEQASSNSDRVERYSPGSTPSLRKCWQLISAGRGIIVVFLRMWFLMGFPCTRGKEGTLFPPIPTPPRILWTSRDYFMWIVWRSLESSHPFTCSVQPTGTLLEWLGFLPEVISHFLLSSHSVFGSWPTVKLIQSFYKDQLLSLRTYCLGTK